MNCTEVVGKVQAFSRVEPFNDIKNCMAKAAGMSAINEIVDQQHFHSDDEVGVFLHGWGMNAKNPAVVLSAESREWLREHNISASRCEDPHQQRVVHIGTILQPSTGEITCFYCRFIDSNFPDVFKTMLNDEHKPTLFCVNERDHVYAVCSNQNVKEDVISEYIGKYIISFAIAQRQQLCIERDIECARYDSFSGQIFGF